jgi:hypothetical protein
MKKDSAALEVIPFTREDCAAGVLRFAAKGIYAAIGMGLYFLKAHALYARPAGRPKSTSDENRVKFTQLPEFTEGDEEKVSTGFDQFLREVFQETPHSALSRKTVFNYMQAARRMGLTVDSTDADVEALEASNALAGKKVSSLYALPPAKGKKTETALPEKDPVALGRILLEPVIKELGEFCTECGKKEGALYVIPVPEVEEMKERLRTGLDMVNEVLRERTGKEQPQAKARPAKKAAKRKGK